jgi:hypothetical protein
MPTLDQLFADFLRERVYLKNVSPKTRIWYETAWKAFRRENDDRIPHAGAVAGVRATTPRAGDPASLMQYLPQGAQRFLPLAP